MLVEDVLATLIFYQFHVAHYGVLEKNIILKLFVYNQDKCHESE